MSQDKVYTPKEFLKWSRKRKYTTFIIQFKLDGISLELQYKDGVFIRAVTRGDGLVGDDVTANVIRMKGFIPKLNSNFTGAVQPEAVLFHDTFLEKYNDRKNCRNAASGLVRRKNGKGCEDLNLIYFDAISITEEVEF